MAKERLRGKILQGIQRWAVPLLLIGVAARQITLVRAAGLSPWHGGGFGMFASIDRDERRLVQLQTTDCQGKQTIQILTPETAGLNEKAWKHLTTAPKASLMRSFAAQLLDRASPEHSSDAREFSACLQTMQIQVRRLYFSQASGQMWYAPVTPVVEVTQ